MLSLGPLEVKGAGHFFKGVEVKPGADAMVSPKAKRFLDIFGWDL